MQELSGQRKGTKKYFHDGYFYHIDPRSANVGNAFICSYRYRRWHCPVTAQKNDNEDITVKGEHSHSPTSFQEYQRFEEFKEKLKKQARESINLPHTIVNKLKIEYSDVAHLILQNSAKMHVIRERIKFQPRLPERLNELGSLLVGYEPVQGIYQGQVIESETSSAVIFASNTMLERLNNCSELYVDGTFKCVPKKIGAKQLLIFHMRKMDVGIASVFVLCSNQTTELYNGIWNFLLERAPGLRENLKVVMMDFERALIKSVKESMPNVTIRGCWFHFTRAISCHWQDLGLKNVPSTLVQDILSLAWVLPLLPKEDFPVAIEFYRKKADQVESEYQDSVNKFIDYLENQWLRIAEVVSLWRSPKRTNNICESFHRWLVQDLGVHPNLYAFMGKLATIITKIEGKWEDLERDGNSFGNKRYKEAVIDSYINCQQIALFNRKINVGEFLMKMKTQSVKNFMQYKLYSPHNIKNLNREDICGPEELVYLLEYSKTVECINSTPAESPEVIQEREPVVMQEQEITPEAEATKESGSMQDTMVVPKDEEFPSLQELWIVIEEENELETTVKESEIIIRPTFKTERQIYRQSRIVRKKKPVCLCCTSEAPPRKIKDKKLQDRPTTKSKKEHHEKNLSSKIIVQEIKKKKKSCPKLVKELPRYKLSPFMKKALKEAEKKKRPHNLEITEDEPRFKLSPSLRNVLRKKK